MEELKHALNSALDRGDRGETARLIYEIESFRATTQSSNLQTSSTSTTSISSSTSTTSISSSTSINFVKKVIKTSKRVQQTIEETNKQKEDIRTLRKEQHERWLKQKKKQ